MDGGMGSRAKRGAGFERSGAGVAIVEALGDIEGVDEQTRVSHVEGTLVKSQELKQGTPREVTRQLEAAGFRVTRVKGGALRVQRRVRPGKVLR
jgi:hypothetical protein